MGANRYGDVQIAVHTAVYAVIAASANADGVTVVNTCGDFDLTLFGNSNATFARAFLAGLIDYLACAAALSAYRLITDGAEGGTLYNRNVTGTVAIRAGLNSAALFGALAVTGIAGGVSGYFYFLFAAVCGLLKREDNLC